MRKRFAGGMSPAKKEAMSKDKKLDKPQKKAEKGIASDEGSKHGGKKSLPKEKFEYKPGRRNAKKV